MHPPPDDLSGTKTEYLIEQGHRLMDEATRSGLQFLAVDIELAFTMLERASSTRDEAARRRSLANAAEAMRVIPQMLRKLNATPAEREHLLDRLAELQERLEAAAVTR